MFRKTIFWGGWGLGIIFFRACCNFLNLENGDSALSKLVRLKNHNAMCERNPEIPEFCSSILFPVSWFYLSSD